MSIYNFTLLKSQNANISSGAVITGQSMAQIKVNIVPEGSITPSMTVKIKGTLNPNSVDFTDPNANWTYISFVETDSATLISGATGLNITSLRPYSIVFTGGTNYFYTVEISNYSAGVVSVYSININ